MIPALEERYAGKGYGAFKSDLAEVVVSSLSPIQERLAQLEANPEQAHAVLSAGADRARVRAVAKMNDVRERVGLGLG